MGHQHGAHTDCMHGSRSFVSCKAQRRALSSKRSSVFWDITLYSPVKVNWRYWGICSPPSSWLRSKLRKKKKRHVGGKRIATRILQPWWRRYIPPKCGLCSPDYKALYQKIKTFITIALRTSNLLRVFQVPLSWPHNSESGRPKANSNSSGRNVVGYLTNPFSIETIKRRMVEWMMNHKKKILVRKRIIPTERPPLVNEVSANFCGQRVSRDQRNGSPRPLISIF
jgi:hypothetical protein